MMLWKNKKQVNVNRLKTEDKNRFGNRNKKTSFLFCIALN